jgi:hypothetical protein
MRTMCEHGLAMADAAERGLSPSAPSGFAELLSIAISPHGARQGASGWLWRWRAVEQGAAAGPVSPVQQQQQMYLLQQDNSVVAVRAHGLGAVLQSPCWTLAWQV